MRAVILPRDVPLSSYVVEEDIAELLAKDPNSHLYRRQLIRDTACSYQRYRYLWGHAVLVCHLLLVHLSR